jgi:hypothetical protein
MSAETSSGARSPLAALECECIRNPSHQRQLGRKTRSKQADPAKKMLCIDASQCSDEFPASPIASAVTM